MIDAPLCRILGYSRLAWLLPLLCLVSCGKDTPAQKPLSEAAPSGTRTAMRHRMSAYTRDAADPAAARKRLATANDAHRQRVEAMMSKYRSSPPSKQTALAALAEAGAIESDAQLSVVKELQSHPDPEVRGRALASVEGFSNLEMLPLIAQALTDTDVDVRLQGVQNLAPMVGPETVPVINTAFEDPDANVRQTAFLAAMNQEPAVRNQMLRQALASRYPDVSLSAILASQGIHHKDLVPLWITALNHAETNVRSQAFEAMSLTFQQDFNNSGTAQSWWNNHQGDYDENLVLSDDAARRLFSK